MFDLMRPSRAFLAVSDVLTGYFLLRFSANTVGNQSVVPYLLAAGALLAVAGSAWQRVFAAAARDPEKDAPPEEVSPTARFVIACLVTIAGLMCAMTGGYGSFRVGAILVVLLLARATLLRKVEIVYPLVTGLCRGGQLVLGMTAHPEYLGLLDSRETFLPPILMAVYTATACVLTQAGESAASHSEPVESNGIILTMREEEVDKPVLWFGGLSLMFLPLAAGGLMPWRWLSWSCFLLLDMAVLAKLIPALAYRTHADVRDMVGTAMRGAVWLNAGVLAGLAHYQPIELQTKLEWLSPYLNGWEASVPYNYELAIMAIVVALAIPAWLLKRVSPRV